jgi:L-seryl-tRNA(Ser) seleniumtransferase
MRVHPSNYRIVGFAAAPPTSDLAAIAHKTGLLLYEDLGSGAVISLTKFGVRDEPTVADSLSAGVDIVTFSGDKLLGGPQAGIIVGRSEVVQRLRHHPLYRALRVDKLVLTALEATLESYAAGRHVDEVPLVSMLAVTAEEIERRASTFVDALRKRNITAMTLEGTSALGGGSAPMVELPTTLVALASQHASRLERELRLGEPPVIARILDDQVVIDLRAVSPEDGDLLLDLIAAAFTRCQPESHP